MTNPQFQAFANASLSVIAAHTILRAIADRAKLVSDQDIFTYVSAIAGTDGDARQVALTGLHIVASQARMPLSQLPEDEANGYIHFLADFALKRAAGGKTANPDLGRTLLAGLRQVGNAPPPEND